MCDSHSHALLAIHCRGASIQVAVVGRPGNLPRDRQGAAPRECPGLTDILLLPAIIYVDRHQAGGLEFSLCCKGICRYKLDLRAVGTLGRPQKGGPDLAEDDRRSTGGCEPSQRSLCVKHRVGRREP